MNPIKSPISINLSDDENKLLKLLCSVYSADPSTLLKALIHDAAMSIPQRLPQYVGFIARQLFVEKLQQKADCRDKGLNERSVYEGGYNKYLKIKMFKKKEVRDLLKKPFRTKRLFMQMIASQQPYNSDELCLVPNNGFIPQREIPPLPPEIMQLFQTSDPEPSVRNQRLSSILTKRAHKQLSAYSEAIRNIIQAASYFPPETKVKNIKPLSPSTQNKSVTARLTENHDNLLRLVAKMVEDALEQYRIKTLRISEINNSQENFKPIREVMNKGLPPIDAIKYVEVLKKFNIKKAETDILIIAEELLKTVQRKMRARACG